MAQIIYMPSLDGYCQDPDKRSQVQKHIATVCLYHPAKMEQLEKVQSITFSCTSDDVVDIVCELYSGNVCRILITGTRSRMTITYNTLSMEIVRKKRNEQPWCIAADKCHCQNIFDIAEEMIMFPG